jgi:hypothetical protein
VIGGSPFRPLSDELTTAARQDQKNTASQDQARQTGAGDGAGNWVWLSINEVIHNGYTRAELTRRQSYIATCYPDTANFE